MMMKPKTNYNNETMEKNNETDKLYITVVGFRNYFGIQDFSIGGVLKCVKGPSCPYDDEAIAVVLEPIGKVGYVANSTDTKAGGTFSAGRLYEKVDETFYVKIMFITYTKVICEVLQ